MVNEWANSIGQGTTFSTLLPTLQSCVVQLDSTYNVGGGSGTPAAGNWLFVIASWTQDPSLAEVHVGVSDDARDWYRQHPASSISGETRTAIAYTANISSPSLPVPGYVYVAPDGQVAAMTVLVVEVSGLGPWDTAGAGYPVTNYAGAATSLTLSGGAPGAASFFIAAVGGDSTAASQAFAPAGWTTLHTVSQSDGSDQLASNYLTSAYLASSSSSQSVSASASATDLSGSMLAVYAAGANPIPATQNPNWPYLKLEAAFGSGYNTPVSEMTWTDLTNRLWDWDEQGGIQFQLGQLQSGQVTVTLDNFDNYLCSANSGSPYYSSALNSNMSFESGISPWALTDPDAAQSAVQSSAEAYSGQYSMFVTPGTGKSVVLSEQVAATVGSAYTASAWFFSPGGWVTGGQVQINWYNASHGYLSTSNTTPTALPAGVWTQCTLTATAPASTAFAQLVVDESGSVTSANTFYVDEAAIVAGSSVVATHLVAPGTPVRIRAALGTIGGTTVNRWYVVMKNAGEWTEKIGEEDLRRYVELSCTDLWAALSETPPTFYRAEVYADGPYAWWPCDDQPGTAGVLPTALLNAAPGNTSTLNVVLSPNGGTAQSYSDEAGNNTNVAAGDSASGGDYHSGFPPGIAVYATGAGSGWMPGDPLSAAASISATGNPVQATPGSAAWQASGQAGSTGSYGWFLSCNDANFPPLSGGITVETWFNAGFYGSANGWLTDTSTGATDNLTFHSITGQPYNTQITIWEIATGSHPVCTLYLDTSGHLILETFNGASGTTHSIYASSDLRSNSWHMVTVELTTTTWQVWLDGGANANASGTATGMTSAWTWFIANGDLGSNGGSSAGTGLVHGGNISLAHITVYPFELPFYRVLDHYWAAISAFGQLPAPEAVQIAWIEQPATPTASSVSSGSTQLLVVQDALAPDGTIGTVPSSTSASFIPYSGYSYGASTGVSVSAVVTATAPGSITSGVSAWSAGATNYNAGTRGLSGTHIDGVALWISWTGLAPSFNVYTSADLGAETEAAVVSGNGDSFKSGYGSGASGAGVAQVSSGSGASPPSSPTSVGDTVQQRIERLMQGGKTTSPQRCIDPAALLVQAPGNSGGGTQAGAAIQAIQQSDSGMLYIDSQNNLAYWDRAHLGAQYSNPVWKLGTDTGETPYWRQLGWPTDPQRIINAITVAPLSPTGAALPEYTPTDVSGVESSQNLYGAQPYQVTSWLQDTSEMQSQADWLFSNWGTPRRRVENVKVDAASHPAAWPMVLGCSVGDILTVRDWQIGGGGSVYTYRVTELRRHLEFGGPDGRETVGAVWLTCDFEPSSYWS